VENNASPKWPARAGAEAGLRQPVRTVVAAGKDNGSGLRLYRSYISVWEEGEREGSAKKIQSTWRTAEGLKC
jgi:hypothetical protein